MEEKRLEKLHGFFVTAFNEILAWEDQSLRKIGRTDISVREMHIIEAVSILEEDNLNTMANIAKVLSVSPGALTTGVNALVKKGYLTRRHDENDRRRVLVTPTETGMEVNSAHKKFHDEMVEFVSQIMSDNEMDTLLKALEKLTEFFMKKAAVKR